MTRLTQVAESNYSLKGPSKDYEEFHTTAGGHQRMFQEIISLEMQKCPVWACETREPLDESGWSQAGPREGRGHWILD